jgi:hypothetical protein
VSEEADDAVGRAETEMKEDVQVSKLTNAHASRRVFLRNTGKTVAAAIGMAALPGIVRASGPSTPYATTGSSNPDGPLAVVTYHCYANAQSCGIGCSDIRVKYNCVATGCASFCTNCQIFADYHEDYTFQVPSCL